MGYLRAERGLWGALDEQVPPESSAEAGKGSRGGTVDLQSHRMLPQQCPKLLSRVCRALLVWAGNEQTNEAGERGEVPLFAALELLPGEREKVLVQGRLDAVMIGVIRLNHGVPAARAPAGAAYHLGEQCKRSLTRTEIREVQADVRREDPHDRHVRVVMSLGNHLRPYQDVEIPALESL
jgi:hypothetical protein